MRETARMLLPFTSIPIICALFDVLSLFMVPSPNTLKHFVHFKNKAKNLAINQKNW